MGGVSHIAGLIMWAEPVKWAERDFQTDAQIFCITSKANQNQNTFSEPERFLDPDSNYRRMISVELLTDANQLPVCLCVGDCNASKTQVRSLNFTSKSCETGSEQYFWTINEPLVQVMC